MHGLYLFGADPTHYPSHLSNDNCNYDVDPSVLRYILLYLRRHGNKGTVSYDCSHTHQLKSHLMNRMVKRMLNNTMVSIMVNKIVSRMVNKMVSIMVRRMLNKMVRRMLSRMVRRMLSRMVIMNGRVRIISALSLWAILTCHAPMLEVGCAKGRWRMRQSLKPSECISVALLIRAHSAAKGKTEENRNTYPN